MRVAVCGVSLQAQRLLHGQAGNVKGETAYAIRVCGMIKRGFSSVTSRKPEFVRSALHPQGRHVDPFKAA